MTQMKYVPQHQKQLELCRGKKSWWNGCQRSCMLQSKYWNITPDSLKSKWKCLPKIKLCWASTLPHCCALHCQTTTWPFYLLLTWTQKVLPRVKPAACIKLRHVDKLLCSSLHKCVLKPGTAASHTHTACFLTNLLLTFSPWAIPTKFNHPSLIY